MADDTVRDTQLDAQQEASSSIETQTEATTVPPIKGASLQVEQEMKPRRQFLIWLWRVPVLLFFTAAGWALLRAYRTLFLRETAALEAEFVAAEPVPIISVNLLETRWQSSSWQAIEFTVAQTPAILVQSPEAVEGGLEIAGQHLIAFSRVCTHQGCAISLNREVDAIAAAYNYRPKAPSLVCPCHYSVFSVLEAGKAKSGPARLPLPRVRLENRAEVITATGIERYQPS